MALPVPLGRPPSTSRSELERIAFDLFARHGFEATTVEEIASAAGIGRRTFFRYFASKNDVVWGDFEGHLAQMRAELVSADPALPLGSALVAAVVSFNAYPPAEMLRHRQRMTLIFRVADLQAHSTLQFAKWREVVADFAAQRLGRPAADLAPQLVAYTALGASLAAYEHWLHDETEGLTEVLRSALDVWASPLGVWASPQ